MNARTNSVIMVKTSFVYVWEYLVQEKHREEFKQVYGPSGDWVKFFTGAEGYLGTNLFQDQNNPNRFITTDFWRSKADRDKYRHSNSDAFEQLDLECEALTIQEKFIGEFDNHTTIDPRADNQLHSG